MARTILPHIQPSLYSGSHREEELTPLPSSPTTNSNIDDLFQNSVDEQPMPNFVVMKFGGTSIAKYLSNIVETIVPSQHIQNKRIPVLVCSAQSYTSKTEGTTQCLLDAIEIAQHHSTFITDAEVNKNIKYSERAIHAGPFTPPPTPPQAESPTRSTHALPTLIVGSSTRPPSTIIDGIFERHCSGARRVIQEACKDPAGGNILSRLEAQLREDCDRVINLLSAVQTLGEISDNTRDKIVSVGELMSCRTVVAALRSRNISARLVDLTDLNVPNIMAQDRTSLDHFLTAIRHKLISSSVYTAGETPILVATGFFGRVPGSLLEYIGRGYTDVCAALCARAVAADELQIWKEVDGVFSADPRKIKSAHLLPEITSAQAKLLTAYGSEVIHHRAIDQAICAKIPITVKNVMNPTGPGTRVVTSTNAAPAVVQNNPAPSSAAPSVFAVTILNDLELVDVRFKDWELTPSRHPLSIVLDVVKQDKHNKMAMDLITTSQDEVNFIVTHSDSPEDRETSMEQLKRVAAVTISPRMSYIQVVLDSPSQPSIFIAIVKALADAQIEVAKFTHRCRGDGIGFVIQTSVALKAGEIVHNVVSGVHQ
ncbi:hypothetical protein DXG01_004769 [Tephrocybe rancida]|nr:hypothetical protein DXG01_004769 [Tephrocybe rancida]